MNLLDYFSEEGWTEVPLKDYWIFEEERKLRGRADEPHKDPNTGEAWYLTDEMLKGIVEEHNKSIDEHISKYRYFEKQVEGVKYFRRESRVNI